MFCIIIIKYHNDKTKRKYTDYEGSRNRNFFRRSVPTGINTASLRLPGRAFHSPGEATVKAQSLAFTDLGMKPGQIRR